MVKPTPTQLKAKQEYAAISAQLHAEKLKYLELMERGCALAVHRLAIWQATCWREVAKRWAELWGALGVEGEGNTVVGAGKAVRIWWEGWEEVEHMVGELGVVNPAVRLPRRAAERPSANALAQRAQRYDQPVDQPAAVQSGRAAAAPQGVHAAAENGPKLALALV